MKNLEDIADNLISVLDEKDTVREVAFKSSRAVIRVATTAVRKMHNDEDVTKLLAEARDEASRLKSLLSDHPDLYHSGFVENGFQELVEACIVTAIVKKEPFPEPEELGVTPTAYILGLGDTVGELRRFVISALRKDMLEDAEYYLEQMDIIYEVLMRFDYPSALVSIRRKQDIARGLIEKTRGEFAVALSNKHLKNEIKTLEQKLEKSF
jgi:translin